MSNPNHPAWRPLGITVGAVLILVSIFGSYGKAELFLVGAGIIYVCIFRWNAR